MQKIAATDDEKAIRDLVETWMTATKTGNIRAVLDLMTDDAIFMVPGRDPFGKEAFKKAAEDMKSGKTSHVGYEGESNIEEIKVMGDWAYIRNRLKVTTIPLDDDVPISRSGFTLTILRKEPDGKWRLARDANLLTIEE
jgi:uncharacterized protein (TIGR02246 family)